MKKLFKKIVSAVSALAMVFTMAAAPAKAATVGTGSVTPGTSVAITSQLKIGTGIAVPSLSFTYTFTQDKTGTDPNYTTTALNIADVTFDFSDSLRGTGNKDDEVLTLQKTISVTPVAAGVYKYSVKQKALSPANPKVTEDTKEYTMYITVENKAQPDGSTVPTIKNIVVVDDTNATTPGDGTGIKVDGTPTTPDSGDTDGNGIPNDSDNTTAEPGDGSDINPNGFVFTNIYKETITDVDENGDGDTTDDGDVPGAAFQLKNNVTGNMGDKTKDFTYTITVTYPLSETDAAPTTGKKGTTAVTFTGTNRTYTATVTLKDAETFKFTSLPVGAKVTVKQNAEVNYTPSYAGASNGTAVSKSGTANTILTAEKLLVGSNGAKVDFTNNYESNNTPTGIIVNILPYIVMMLLAMAGVVLVVASRRRKESM